MLASQTTIKVSESARMTTKRISHCRDGLDNSSKVSLLWVPEHKNIEGNERGDEWASTDFTPN